MGNARVPRTNASTRIPPLRGADYAVYGALSKLPLWIDILHENDRKPFGRHFAAHPRRTGHGTDGTLRHGGTRGHGRREHTMNERHNRQADLEMLFRGIDGIEWVFFRSFVPEGATVEQVAKGLRAVITRALKFFESSSPKFSVDATLSTVKDAIRVLSRIAGHEASEDFSFMLKSNQDAGRALLGSVWYQAMFQAMATEIRPFLEKGHLADWFADVLFDVLSVPDESVNSETEAARLQETWKVFCRSYGACNPTAAKRICEKIRAKLERGAPPLNMAWMALVALDNDGRAKDTQEFALRANLAEVFGHAIVRLCPRDDLGVLYVRLEAAADALMNK